MALKNFLKKYLFNKVSKEDKKDTVSLNYSILGIEYLHNAKLLSTREELLKCLKPNSIVAEVGVDKGCFSEKILKIINPQKLHLIDSWSSTRFDKSHKAITEERFNTQIISGQVEINQGISYEIADLFSDNYFDWIYIDTDHSFETTIKELRNFCNKVKTNGVIAGHDFIDGNWNTHYKYGVIEAVYQFCQEEKWELLYLTMERHIHPSFAIRRKDMKLKNE